MAISITRNLTDAEKLQTQTALNNMASVGANSNTNNTFRYVATFDGSNNDQNNPTLSDSPHVSNGRC
jgi:hypothetical protein